MYKPLDISDDIRLLYLQPRRSGITCEIRHVKFSDKPQYEALSYMWGDSTDQRTIMLDDSAFSIRENLWSALSNLQLENAPRALWIDAVCINQQDLKERNHQVNQMGRIYSEAQRIVLWLGESDTASESAFQEISKGPPIQHAWHRMYKTAPDLDAMRPFWTREYWDRLWIIQELVLAADILVQCGSRNIPWAKVSEFFEYIEDRARWSHTSATKAMATEIRRTMPARLYRQWRDRRQGQMEDNNLHDLCLRYIEAKCEDPRDKFYGLLSFATECCRGAVPVDYSLSRYEICGLVLQHHATAHTYDEGFVSPNGAVDNPEFAGRTPTLIIKSSQIFHHALGITGADCPAATRSAYQLTETQINNVKECRKLRGRHMSNSIRKIFDSVEPQKGRIESTDWTRRLSFKIQLPKSLSRSASIMSSKPKKPLVKVLANIKGRITHLSPRLKSAPSIRWTETPYVFMAGDALICQELACIQRLFDKERLRSSSSDPPIISSQLDLVAAITSSESRVFFPTNMDLPNPKQPSPTWAPSHFLVLLDQVWLETRYALQKILRVEPGVEDCRIAIEENGLIYFVPVATELGDLICCFPQSDSVAILREKENADRIVGRATDFLLHPDLMKSFRSDDKYPTTDEVRDFSVTLELDTATLQILTRASSMTNVQGSTLVRNSLKSMALVVGEVEEGLLATRKNTPPIVDDQEPSLHFTILR